MLRTLSLLTVILTFVLTACQTTSKTGTSGDSAKDKANAEIAAKADGAKKQITKSASAMTCVNGSDSRTIEVVSTNGGCEVKYTKFGTTSTPAQSVNGTSHCESILKRMTGNLTAAGFTCS